jgi:hypothetical protein
VTVAKSPTELIRELTQQVAISAARDEERDRLVERLVGKVDKLEARAVTLEVENAALKQQLQDHLAQYQEGDRRRWTLHTVLVGAVLSLASGLIATLVKK